VIAFRDVTKRYGDGTVGVRDLSLEVPTGRITVLLGSSGCGKTTALRMANRLIEPTEGTVELDGRDVATLPLLELRRGIGYVIQQIGLFPNRTIAENVATVPRLLGWDRARRRARALELLELVGLDATTADRLPRQLSGGQQQRVGVARALAADPPVLLMDEPFGAVDPVGRAALQREFSRLQRELGKTVVFVTHDVDEAVTLGDRIAVMRRGGEVVQVDTPEALLARPADPFVAQFLGATRGIELLTRRPAHAVPTIDLDPDGIDGWLLAEDAAGRPTAWVRDDDAVLAEPVGPEGRCGTCSTPRSCRRSGSPSGSTRTAGSWAACRTPRSTSTSRARRAARPRRVGGGELGLA
jgi:osmoprotectant transport system ATP-binding protein